MCLKDKIKKYQKPRYYFGVTFAILIIAGFVTWIFLPLFNLDDLIKTHTVTDIIAIITAFALAFGVLTYIGNIAVMKTKYSLIELRFGFKEYTITLGLLFLVVIAAIYFYAKQNFTLLNVLYYISAIGVLAFFLGFTIILKPDDNKKVTLKMITCNESGCKELATRTDLELYQITGTDYHFKDSNGKEFIIPIGQIQEIESQD